MKHKLYGEDEKELQNQVEGSKNKIFDFANVMLEMSKGQRIFGHQLFDLKFDLEKYYKIIDDKRIICVKSD
jgi:signal transduction histidine kinase